MFPTLYQFLSWLWQAQSRTLHGTNLRKKYRR
jgi:hypothetical protein